jgi:hypothetical protein
MNDSLVSYYNPASTSLSYSIATMYRQKYYKQYVKEKEIAKEIAKEKKIKLSTYYVYYATSTILENKLSNFDVDFTYSFVQNQNAIINNLNQSNLKLSLRERLLEYLKQDILNNEINSNINSNNQDQIKDIYCNLCNNSKTQTLLVARCIILELKLSVDVNITTVNMFKLALKHKLFIVMMLLLEHLKIYYTTDIDTYKTLNQVEILLLLPNTLQCDFNSLFIKSLETIKFKNDIDKLILLLKSNKIKISKRMFDTILSHKWFDFCTSCKKIHDSNKQLETYVSNFWILIGLMLHTYLSSIKNSNKQEMKSIKTNIVRLFFEWGYPHKINLTNDKNNTYCICLVLKAVSSIKNISYNNSKFCPTFIYDNYLIESLLLHNYTKNKNTYFNTVNSDVDAYLLNVNKLILQKTSLYNDVIKIILKYFI